jgi:hypothetical protein
MSLQDWSKLTGILPTHHTTLRGAVSVISTNNHNEHYAELFHLTDYHVSSVCGIVLWFVPKVRTQ